jgi:Fe-S cluster biogenesis protein NfuA
VEQALDEIRPYLQGEGGEIEVVRIDGDEVFVRLVGSCAECAMQAVTMKAGVERILRARVPAVGKVTRAD